MQRKRGGEMVGSVRAVHQPLLCSCEKPATTVIQNDEKHRATIISHTKHIRYKNTKKNKKEITHRMILVTKKLMVECLPDTMRSTRATLENCRAKLVPS